MLEWLTDFKLFALYGFVIYVLIRKVQHTPIPEDEGTPRMDLSALRREIRRQEWNERPYNERLSWSWIRFDR